MGRNRTNWLLKWIPLCCILCLPRRLVSGEIRYSIPEELQTGAFVGNIAGDLGLDVKELSARGFRIVTGPSKQYLGVNLDNGVLFVKEKIDREQLCGGSSLTCALSFETVIENPLNLYRVEVEILDVNDNAPSFSKSQIRLEISELAAPGTRLALERAHDPDVGTNSLQTYQLGPNDHFILVVQTRGSDGKLPMLVLERPLDREKQTGYRLELIAKDGGIPERSGTVQIIITVQDANDNAPVFQQPLYSVSVFENAVKGTLVLQLNATDLDDGSNGEIVYSFSSHTSARVRELFSLNAQTGEIRLKGALDYEEKNAFELNVQAADKGLNSIPGYCDVLVQVTDVNDNAPEVTLTSFYSPISEDALPGTVVALISATDKDSGEYGRVQCQLANNLPFQLVSSLENYYKLLTQHSLNRENISGYDIAVVCSDGGNPPLTSTQSIRVEVSDVNDNAPGFPQASYTARVPENNAIGSSIFSVTAYDPDSNQNAQLTYTILESRVQGESVSSLVSMNSATGTIVAQRSYDYEQLKNFEIRVRALDNGVPSLSSNVSVNVVILDENDNSPVIVSPLPEFGSTVTETVSRLAEPGYLVAKVSAIDADTGQNGRLSYQILQATDPGLFTISPDTGEIWTIRSVSNRDANKQRLVIVVKDNGSPSLSATVTIMLSVVGGDTEILSDRKGLSGPAEFGSPLSLYLVIALGSISSIFLVVLIILAVQVHRNRTAYGAYSCAPSPCCCLETRHSLNGIQKASRNVQIPPNYVEVFGGDPLSQSFRYGSCSTSGSSKGDFRFSHTGRASTHGNDIRREVIGLERNPRVSHSANYRSNENGEVRLICEAKP